MWLLVSSRYRTKTAYWMAGCQWSTQWSYSERLTFAYLGWAWDGSHDLAAAPNINSILHNCQSVKRHSFITFSIQLRIRSSGITLLLKKTATFLGLWHPFWRWNTLFMLQWSALPSIWFDFRLKPCVGCIEAFLKNCIFLHASQKWMQ